MPGGEVASGARSAFRAGESALRRRAAEGADKLTCPTIRREPYSGSHSLLEAEASTSAIGFRVTTTVS